MYSIIPDRDGSVIEASIRSRLKLYVQYVYLFCAYNFQELGMIIGVVRLCKEIIFEI